MMGGENARSNLTNTSFQMSCNKGGLSGRRRENKNESYLQ